MSEPRYYNIAFTAQALADRIDRNGKPYLFARGGIARGDKPALIRSFRASGKALEAIQGVMAVGKEVRLRGFYDQIMNDDGSSAEYLVVTGLARELKAA